MLGNREAIKQLLQADAKPLLVVINGGKVETFYLWLPLTTMFSIPHSKQELLRTTRRKHEIWFTWNRLRSKEVLQAFRTKRGSCPGNSRYVIEISHLMRFKLADELAANCSTFIFDCLVPNRMLRIAKQSVFLNKPHIAGTRQQRKAATSVSFSSIMSREASCHSTLNCLVFPNLNMHSSEHASMLHANIGHKQAPEQVGMPRALHRSLESIDDASL
eukprot:4213709-Pleurochrysis_carterae.AAC.4